MPQAFPEEFRRDVVAVALRRQARCPRSPRTSESPSPAKISPGEPRIGCGHRSSYAASSSPIGLI